MTSQLYCSGIEQKLKVLDPAYGVSSIPFNYLIILEDVVTSNYDAVEPKVKGEVVAYPNPFRLDSGTSLGYDLSKPMDITIQIYDIFGMMVYEKHFLNGHEGAQIGYNRVSISKNDFNGYSLPVSVYFCLIIHNSKVLGKTKLAVVL